MSTGSLGDRRVPGMSSLVGLHVNTGRYRSPASLGNTAMVSEFQTSPTADLGQDFDLILRKCWSEKFGHYFDENDVDMHCQERNEQLQTKNTLKDSKTTEVIDSVPGAELADNTQDSTMDDWTLGTAVPEQDAGQVIEGDMPVNSKYIRYPFWRSTKKRKTFKKQGHQKKWKVVNSNSFELGFDYSRSQLRCCVKETTVEMENELVQFEMECELFLDSASESSSTPKLSNGKEEKVTNVKVSPIKICPQKDVDGLEESEILDIESSVSCKALSVSVLITPDYVGLRYPEHVRRKKKWAVQKASNQVATKYCQNLCNFSYGKKLYFNHRVFKRMPLAINVLYKPEKRSMRNIDQAKGFTRNVRLKEVVNKPSVGEVVARGPARLARARPAPPPPAYALGQHNADRGLETGIVNILINLQHRELTPEDYELLLRLDERVAPKTVPAQVLENLPTDTVSAEKAGEICSVCLNEYVQGEKLKLLPCGHVFHSACIDTWLKNSSMKCPLDGTEIL